MRGCALEHVSPEKNTRDWKPWFPLRRRTGSLAKGNLESVDSAPIWTMLRYYQLNRKQIIGRGHISLLDLLGFKHSLSWSPSLHLFQSGHFTGSCQCWAFPSCVRRLCLGSGTWGNAGCVRALTLSTSIKGQ